MATEPEITSDIGQTTPEAIQPVAAEPTTHQHSPRLLNVCRELGIAPDQAATMDDAALRREIQDAQLEHQIRAARQPRQTQQQVQQPTPQPEPEEGFDLPAELRAKLVDVDPALIEAINHIGKEAVKGRKTAKELAQLRQQQAQRDLHRQVQEVLDSLPATAGSKQARSRAVWTELDALSQAGEVDANTPVDQAVKLAYQNVYGAVEATTQPAPAARPAAKPATVTARPTNRLSPSLQGQLDNLNGNTADDFIP